jgi:hypothetical protein
LPVDGDHELPRQGYRSSHFHKSSIGSRTAEVNELATLPSSLPSAQAGTSCPQWTHQTRPVEHRKTGDLHVRHLALASLDVRSFASRVVRT